MIKHAKVCHVIYDFVFFLFPSLLFNLIYLYKFQGVLNGVLLNIYLVFLLWLILTSLRLIIALIIPRKYLPAINLMLMASAWGILLVFYCLCLVGLNGWGRVPTIMIIKVYASQIHSVMDALNLSGLILLIIAGLAAGLLFIFYKIIWRKTQWLSVVAHQWHWGVSSIVFLSLAGMSTILFWQNFYYADNKYNNEVFLEVLFPELKSQTMQNWRLNSSKVLESKENAARKNYKKSRFKPRNVIVIVIDALRADHLAIYGYSRPTTPFISSLNQNGQLRAAGPVRSVCAESSCGLLSLPRSKYPNAMTAVDFSLYEVLKQYGYKIYFFLSGDHTNFYNLKEAYKPYDSYVDGSSLSSKGFGYVNDDRFVIRELKKMPKFAGKPTYIQFHLMSAHGLGLRFKPNFPYAPSNNYYNLLSFSAIQGGEKKENAAINFYDNGVSQADTMVANIFSILKEKGYLNDALVLIMGDHGELLGEGGLYAHAKTIEEPVLNIPLIIWSSTAHDPSVDLKKWLIMSQVDLAPSVLQALNINIPATWQGVALQSSPKQRAIFVMQGNNVGIYADFNGQIFKLTLDRNNSTEQEWILNANTTGEPKLLKAQIPPALLKEMRSELYQIDK